MIFFLTDSSLRSPSFQHQGVSSFPHLGLLGPLYESAVSEKIHEKIQTSLTITLVARVVVTHL